MKLYAKPHAKVNFGLNVGPLRADGYHEIETIFIPVYGLYDELSFTLSEGINSVQLWQLDQAGERHRIEEDNLVLSAYLALRPFGPPAVSIELEKCIPSGAGLGGGSSDAVSTLRALAPFCRVKPTSDQLFDLALSLGSDCPFFLRQSAAYATSRGEKLTDIENPVGGEYIVLLSPAIHISTAWAFRSLHSSSLPSVTLLQYLQQPRERWSALIVNSFQTIAEHEYPLITSLLHLLKQRGAFYTSLTGSGSSLYGLFDHNPAAEDWVLPPAVRMHSSRLSF